MPPLVAIGVPIDSVGLLQYTEAPDSDGHFVVFEVEAAMRQSIYFLSSLATTGVATIVAP